MCEPVRIPDTLIIVCGHSVYHPKGPSADYSILVPENWKLSSFQAPVPSKGKLGEHLTFIAHIRTAIELWDRLARAGPGQNRQSLGSKTAQEGEKWRQLLYAKMKEADADVTVVDMSAEGAGTEDGQPKERNIGNIFPRWPKLGWGDNEDEEDGYSYDATDSSTSVEQTRTLPALCFSGGKTKGEECPSEAESYAKVASVMSRALSDREPALRRYLEIPKTHLIFDTYATDSFHNLLFPIISFRARFGKYPQHLNLVTHNFKNLRFTMQHIPTLNWPIERFGLVGIDPPMSDDERNQTYDSEMEKAYFLFQDDPYGLGKELFGKRIRRGWMSLTANHSVRQVTGQVDGILFGAVVDGIHGNPLPDGEVAMLLKYFNHPDDISICEEAFLKGARENKGGKAPWIP